MEQLIKIQHDLKAPKNLYNSFGNYNYRNAESILEAVKPLLYQHGCTLTLTDEIKQVGEYIFVESTAVFSDGTSTIEVKAQAGINPNKKGMDIAQSFGASSSYARKYCLNGLFLIDDTKDADATNDHKTPTQEEKDMLVSLVYDTNYDDNQKAKALETIKNCNNYDLYAKIQHKLENDALPIDQVVNPNQKDIKKHIKKVTG